MKICEIEDHPVNKAIRFGDTLVCENCILRYSDFDSAKTLSRYLMHSRRLGYRVPEYLDNPLFNTVLFILSTVTFILFLDPFMFSLSGWHRYTDAKSSTNLDSFAKYLFFSLYSNGSFHFSFIELILLILLVALSGQLIKSLLWIAIVLLTRILYSIANFGQVQKYLNKGRSDALVLKEAVAMIISSKYGGSNK